MSFIDKFRGIFIPRFRAGVSDPLGDVEIYTYYRCEHAWDILRANPEARPEIQHYTTPIKCRHAKTGEVVEVSSILMCDECRRIWIGSTIASPAYPRVFGPHTTTKLVIADTPQEHK